MRHGLYPTLDGRLVVAKEHPRINFPRPINFPELKALKRYVAETESLRISLTGKYTDTLDYRDDSGNERGEKIRTEGMHGSAGKSSFDDISVTVREQSFDQEVRFLGLEFTPILKEVPLASQHYDLIGSITRGVKSYFLTHPYRVNSAAQR